MITVIAEHSVDLNLLPEKANILDAGCRGFQFTNYFRSMGHTVVALDIDLLEGHYQRIALIGGNQPMVAIKKMSDPNATHVVYGQHRDSQFVPATNISKLSTFNFDVIKLDIEGEEKGVIMSMDKPYAKQLSIEFHLHTGVYGIQQVKEMENKLKSLGYYPAKHEMTKQHGLSMNYWDSLFILQ